MLKKVVPGVRPRAFAWFSVCSWVMPLLAWALALASLVPGVPRALAIEWGLVAAALGLTIGASELMTGTRERRHAYTGLAVSVATLAALAPLAFFGPHHGL